MASRMLHDIAMDDYLVAAVSIDPSQISESMITHSSDLAYFGEKLAMALETYLRAKVNVRRERARINLETRLDYDMGKRKPTEGVVEAEVENHREVVMAEDDLISAEVELTRAKGVVQAIVSRGDMLRSLGAAQRSEMEREPGTRSRPQQRERG